MLAEEKIESGPVSVIVTVLKINSINELLNVVPCVLLGFVGLACMHVAVGGTKYRVPGECAKRMMGKSV